VVGDPGHAGDEKAAAIRAYYDYPDNVNSYYVGNEDLQPVGPFTVDDIISNMNGKPRCPPSSLLRGRCLWGGGICSLILLRRIEGRWHQEANWDSSTD